MFKAMKKSLKDSKGDYSIRKVMAVVSFLLLVFGYIMQILTGVMISDAFIYIFASITGVNVLGWTWQNIIALKNGNNIGGPME